MESIEQENNEVLEGTLEIPQQRQKLFFNYNEMLDWLAFSRPAGFHMQSGVVNNKACWQLIYVSTGGYDE